eukprot:CAMPEP_0170479648 /NCGR_PEP_ID=MMETSP0208-20121228/805_1 /TAXON_ID=197538 /ORGANISM="Strombidium inclinatum, Strain S3" /LENGTH=103 /DNA_ID=CAMNT_0010752085 /DNA_START=64 /DNA_END=375 /DNA_ORIENTATION=-
MVPLGRSWSQEQVRHQSHLSLNLPEVGPDVVEEGGRRAVHPGIGSALMEHVVDVVLERAVVSTHLVQEVEVVDHLLEGVFVEVGELINDVLDVVLIGDGEALV